MTVLLLVPVDGLLNDRAVESTENGWMIDRAAPSADRWLGESAAASNSRWLSH